MNELVQILAQNSGSAVTAGMFIWYLSKLGKQIDKMQVDNNKIITEYLSSNAKAQLLLTGKLDDFTKIMEEHHKILETVYRVSENNLALAKKKDETIKTFERIVKRGKECKSKGTGL